MRRCEDFGLVYRKLRLVPEQFASECSENFNAHCSPRKMVITWLVYENSLVSIKILAKVHGSVVNSYAVKATLSFCNFWSFKELGES